MADLVLWSSKLCAAGTIVRPRRPLAPAAAGGEAALLRSRGRSGLPAGSAAAGAEPPLPAQPAPTLAVQRLHQAVGDGVAQGHDLVIVQQAEQVTAALRL